MKPNNPIYLFLFFLISIPAYSTIIYNGPYPNTTSISSTISKCKPNEILTPKKQCIKPCTQEIVKQCSNIFKDISLGSNSNVCGYQTDGDVWRTYNDRCQACVESQVLGYVDGKCTIKDEVDVGVSLNNGNWGESLPGVALCENYYVYTQDKGCVKSCQHPEFAACLDWSAIIYQPKFCGLVKNGVWKNFTSACQACKKSGQQSNIIAIADGKCQSVKIIQTPIIKNSSITNPIPTPVNPIPVPVPKDTPIEVKRKCKKSTDCLSVERCMGGFCLNKCASVYCIPGTKCQNGRCINIKKPPIDPKIPITPLIPTLTPTPTIPIIRIVPITPSLPIIPLISPTPQPPTSPKKTCQTRPDEQTCPSMSHLLSSYFNAPTVCITDQSGKYKSYYRNCQICKDITVISYIIVTCQFNDFRI